MNENQWLATSQDFVMNQLAVYCSDTHDLASFCLIQNFVDGINQSVWCKGF